MLMRRGGFKNVCLCGFTRDCMQKGQKLLFPSSPMKLQLLAACAVPKKAIHEATIHTEGLIRLDNSARCIQRQWRSYLQARGPGYRTRICKFYMRQGCRRGVHCTFAHGSHDVRENFDHINHDVREKIPVHRQSIICNSIRKLLLCIVDNPSKNKSDSKVSQNEEQFDVSSIYPFDWNHEVY